MLAKLPTHLRCPDFCSVQKSEADVVLRVFRMIPPMWTPVLDMEGSERYLHTHVKLEKRPLEFTWGHNSVQITAYLHQALEERYTLNS